MVILVTGGAGFIGSHVCEALLARGDEVLCVDNLNSYYSPQQKLSNLSGCLSNPKFYFYPKDITLQEEVEELFQKFKIRKVIHLAAKAGVRPSIEQPLAYRDSNVNGTINLLQLAKKYKVENFIFSSSSSVYGDSSNAPFKEDTIANRPLSPYAASKLACELFCYTYSHLFDLNVTCLRLFTVYGPRGRPDMAPYLFVSKICSGESLVKFGAGDSMRDYTYVGDIVKGIIRAVDRSLGFEIINLGNSNPVSLNDFIKIVEGVTGRNAYIVQKPAKEGDVPLTYADISKAKKILDWEPKVPLIDGMKNFYEWYIENERVKTLTDSFPKA